MRILKKIGQGGLTALKPKNDNTGKKSEISLLDVKALYDRAYDDKAKARCYLKTFKQRLARAKKLDAAYQRQLDKTRSRAHRALL